MDSSPTALVATTLGLPIAAWILSLFGAKQPSGVTPVTIQNYQDAAQRQIQPMATTTQPVSFGAPALILPVPQVINAPTDFFTPTPWTAPQIIAGGGIPQYTSQQFAFQGSPVTSAPVYVPGLVPGVTAGVTSPSVALQRAQ